MPDSTEPACRECVDLGPITPVRCTALACNWAIHGIPDRYTYTRASYLNAHKAAEHPTATLETAP